MSEYTDKAGFSVSINEDVEKFLNAIKDPETRQKISYYAAMQGALVLKRYAQEGFRRKLGEAADHPSKDRKMGGRPFADGVIIKGHKYDLIQVSIMKDYRMKWFETGTDDRYIGNKSHSDFQRGRKTKNTGKHNFRGRIDVGKYGGWFKEARDGHRAEITDAVIRSIDNAFKKLKEGRI